MLKGKKSHSYPNQTTGVLVFVYHVSGSPEELAAYKAVKGEYYREDKKHGNKPCWFSKEYKGEVIDLEISEDGKNIYAIDKVREMATIANQIGGVFGQEFARMGIAQMMGNSAPAPIAETPTPTPAPAPSPDATPSTSVTDDPAFEVEDEDPL